MFNNHLPETSIYVFPGDTKINDMSTNTIKMMTLFSGYESQMMALQLAMSNNTNLAADLVGWSDINPIVQAVHNTVYPEYSDRCYPDVTKIRWEDIDDVDILFASSPCQDVSRLGVRKGMERNSATRSSLVWEVEKAIAIKRPKWFIEENVEGMLDSQDDFEELVRSISSYGYSCSFKVLKGCEYGIPQNRPRMFLVAIRITEDDRNPVFCWPEPTGLQSQPEDLLSDNVDDRYYLTVEETETYIELIKKADKGYETICTSDGKIPMQYQSSQFTKRLSRIVTPLCKNNSIPTLTASGFGGSLESIAGCRKENQACVIEIWEGNLNISPVVTDRKPFCRKIKALKKCPDRERVLEVVDSLEDKQYLRIRRLTPEECLRFMGVEEKHVSRMMHPYASLLQDGYSEQQIKKMTLNSVRGQKFSDYALYGRAGNSIIVNVIAAIFSKVLEYYSKPCLHPSSPKTNDVMTIQEKKRKYSRDYYQRHKDEVRHKSREYHRARRERQRKEQLNVA